MVLKETVLTSIRPEGLRLTTKELVRIVDVQADTRTGFRLSQLAPCVNVNVCQIQSSS
jgi:hypothetical protein